MTKILKTVSAIGLAVATLTAATIVTSNSASALPARTLGHGPVVPNAPFKLPPVWQRLGGHMPITCLACSLPHPQPVGPRPVNVGPTQGPAGAIGESCTYKIECISKTDPPDSEACNNGYASVVKVCTRTPFRNR